MGMLKFINPARILRRFKADRRGVSAVEFALVAPILVMLYLGLAELSLGMMASRKVSHLAATVGDLTAQSESLSTANINDLFEIGSSMLRPYAAGSALKLRITCVTMGSDSKPVVAWSAPNANWVANTDSSAAVQAITVTQLPVGQSLVMTEAEYTYTSPIGNFLPINSKFADKFFHHPRNGTAIAKTA